MSENKNTSSIKPEVDDLRSVKKKESFKIDWILLLISSTIVIFSDFNGIVSSIRGGSGEDMGRLWGAIFSIVILYSIINFLVRIVNKNKSPKVK